MDIKKIYLLILQLFCFIFSSNAQIKLDNWKFKTGNNPEWSETKFDDSQWKTINCTANWDSQGYENYDGYAWYRIRFFLPSTMQKSAYFNDSIYIRLPKIDDCDISYLNGKIIGKMGKMPDEGKYVSAWSYPRKYCIAANDPNIKWDAENVLAIKVYDGDGLGGMFGTIAELSMSELKDYVNIDISNNLKFEKEHMQQKVIINNHYSKALIGNLIVKSFKNNASKPKTNLSIPINIPANSFVDYDVTIPKIENGKIDYSFSENESKQSINISEYTPYILTPPAPLYPIINTPSIYGAMPSHDFLYSIPASGSRPMYFNAIGLPKGLSIDPKTGIITGAVNKQGDYKITINTQNNNGTASKDMIIRIGGQISLTPIMGWNSWNCWGLSVSDEKIRQSAKALIEKGLQQYGWSYINIDDGWESKDRDENGEILSNEKFPNMKNLSNFIHQNGLKLGIYSSPGTQTCGGFLGSWQHEEQDAATYGYWGIDYLKYDWCSYGNIVPKNPSIADYKKPYEIMRNALDKANRDIVYSLCQYGMGDVWQWGEKVGADSWRTTGDINDTWESMSEIGFNQVACQAFSKPSNWNDPDMLVVGWVGWGEQLHKTQLTPSEQYTHISLWSLFSAPMLLGCDLNRLDDFTLNLLTNNEVIAINQDALGKGASRIMKTNELQIWTKELEDGGKAVGIFNMTNQTLNIKQKWSDINLSGFNNIRDLWRQKDIGKMKQKIKLTIPAHGCYLLKLK